jgi:hypothetical protein
MDDRGNIYAQESAPAPTRPAQETTPAREATPTPALLPDPILTVKGLKYIEAEEHWLSEQPIEHFSALYVNSLGECIGRTTFEGGPHEVMVDVSRVLREAEALEAQGVWVAHNHPSGDTHETDADKTLHRSLTECLSRRFIRVLATHIVPGTPKPIQEAEPQMETLWDIECRESERLWKAYGGKPSWIR